MPDNFDKTFDECIDRINRGESLESCLADYPECSEQLEPLLRAVLQTKDAYEFKPSPGAKKAARQRFNAALEAPGRKREARQPLFPSLFGWSRALSTVAVVIVIALIGYFGLRPMLFPPGIIPQPGPVPIAPSPQPGPVPIAPSPQPGPVPIAPSPQPDPIPIAPSPQPSTEGNFVFLISDEVNAIGDFESLTISISKIGLLPGGDTDQWVEFEPEVNEVDLTLVPGDKTQEIWRGNVPEGQYTKVFIYVTGVHGILKETGQTVDVKLPSQKLHISKPFQVTSGSVTSFVYDITVVKSGESGQYILLPQIAQSGADYEPSKGKAKGKQP